MRSVALGKRHQAENSLRHNGIPSLAKDTSCYHWSFLPQLYRTAYGWSLKISHRLELQGEYVRGSQIKIRIILTEYPRWSGAVADSSPRCAIYMTTSVTTDISDFCFWSNSSQDVGCHSWERLANRKPASDELGATA